MASSRILLCAGPCFSSVVYQSNTTSCDVVSKRNRLNLRPTDDVFFFVVDYHYIEQLLVH